MNKTISSVLAIAASALVGCGSSAVPADKLASSEAAIRSAQEVGAPQYPQAALHLRLAQEQTDTARKLIKDGDNDRASYILDRAEADAEVALNMAKEEKLKAEANQTLEQVRNLKAKPATGTMPSTTTPSSMTAPSSTPPTSTTTTTTKEGH